MSRVRRLSWVAAGTLVAALALSACGGGASPGAATGVDVWGVSGGIREQTWTSSFDEWNSGDPALEIEAEFIANDAYKERIRTAIGAGTNPSMFFNWAGGTLVDYVAQDKVVDLTDDTKDVLERVLPSVADAGIIDGKVYAIPNAPSQPVMLYFNRELLDQAGVEVPTTWDELLDAVATLKEDGIAPLALAGQSRWPYLMWIQYLTDRIGGPEVFQRILAGDADAWSDPAITAALEHIQELVTAGGFIDGYASVAADAQADVALVHTGRAAMLLQGSWVYSSFKADAAEWIDAGNLGVVEFPTVDGGAGDPANIVGNPSNYWSVASNSTDEQISAATTYLDERVFSESYTDELIAGGAVPPVIGIEDKLADQDDGDFLTFTYGLVRDAPHFQLSWDQALPPAQAQELLTNLEQIFLLQTTPDQFVSAMNATLK